MPQRIRAPWLFGPCLALLSCSDWPSFEQAPDAPLSRSRLTRMVVGQRAPNEAEASVVGAPDAPIERKSRAFRALVSCASCPIVFKDEERDASDHMMTARLRSALLRLAPLVRATWPEVRLRVTEAWDEEREHGRQSVHYEGRAADVTTSDQDPKKLGKLAALAVSAGLDWVYYEDASHVHVSVKK